MSYQKAEALYDLISHLLEDTGGTVSMNEPIRVSHHTKRVFDYTIKIQKFTYVERVNDFNIPQDRHAYGIAMSAFKDYFTAMLKTSKTRIYEI